MPRPPRLQFPGAIYHLVSRGNLRQKIFHDDGHYERLTRGLEEEVQRSGWEVFAFCWMPNHIHVLLQTPAPNLSAGMQHLLSGYANWYAKRNRKGGHLLQGRYKSFLVEDTSYLWTLSRYIHLNPCNGATPLADRPDGWKHSSYSGYARKSARESFIQYDRLHEAWAGECGGNDPVKAYRRYVDEGLKVAENPLKSSLRNWVIGSDDFLKRMVGLAEKQNNNIDAGLRRRMKTVTPEQVISATAMVHQVDPEEYVGFRSQAPGREMAALICRRYTGVRLNVLSKAFGLNHPDSASNLVRKAKHREEKSSKYRETIAKIEQSLWLKTENQV